jgi:hypothetical protein
MILQLYEFTALGASKMELVLSIMVRFITNPIKGNRLYCLTSMDYFLDILKLFFVMFIFGRKMQIIGVCA